MIKLIILSLLTTFTDTSLEQKACDYFFANIFRAEYPDYKVIEFDNQTDTTTYWGIVDKCENWDDKTKGQIVHDTRQVDPGICDNERSESKKEDKKLRKT